MRVCVLLLGQNLCLERTALKSKSDESHKNLSQGNHIYCIILKLCLLRRYRTCKMQALGSQTFATSKIQIKMNSKTSISGLTAVGSKVRSV